MSLQVYASEIPSFEACCLCDSGELSTELPPQIPRVLIIYSLNKYRVRAMASRQLTALFYILNWQQAISEWRQAMPTMQKLLHTLPPHPGSLLIEMRR